MPQDNLNMKAVAACMSTIAALEDEIFEREGVRVVIRAPLELNVACGYKHMFIRRLGDDSRVELLIRRIQRIIGVHGPVITVVDGFGSVRRPKHTLLGNIRTTYLKP